jgi:hypothetical protein
MYVTDVPNILVVLGCPICMGPRESIISFSLFHIEGRVQTCKYDNIVKTMKGMKRRTRADAIEARTSYKWLRKQERETQNCTVTDKRGKKRKGCDVYQEN